ncbi:hypothetical protein [Kitasatospora cheerisanensis]|uniref:DUF3806 domain-containing protein n=1 Tax=Kitasatospora cheerisanensis KCTC 2395 TaxID=1348663 RepID=A0A066Z3C4_9ACTN|nr:hypothetical protein [Kitasatospora cheerisanensis]KDN88017.1 hypothetical protein KCH_02410 [Kitasatospora cheerisanensis KCTC 2395]
MEREPQQKEEVPAIDLAFIAEQCAALVADNHGRQLDWSIAGLAELDAVCAELIADSPLDDPRMGLWWRLVGAYTGEVMVRSYGGEWADAGDHSDGPAVRALGLTAFPFNTAHRVLLGEEGKSLRSSASALAAIARDRGLVG